MRALRESVAGSEKEETRVRMTLTTTTDQLVCALEQLASEKQRVQEAIAQLAEREQEILRLKLALNSELDRTKEHLAAVRSRAQCTLFVERIQWVHLINSIYCTSTCAVYCTLIARPRAQRAGSCSREGRPVRAKDVGAADAARGGPSHQQPPTTRERNSHRKHRQMGR